MSKVKMSKERKAINEMVGGKVFKQNMGSFICFICEHALIHPVMAQCNHTFCNYCIALWKKHNQYCPICMEKLGGLIPALDINADIELFFATADPGARKERAIVLASRDDSERNACEKLQNLDANSSQSKSTGRIPPKTSTPSRTATAPKAYGQLGKLLTDTQRLERELDGVYSKILTVGSNLNAREDTLMMTKYGAGAMLQGADLPPQSRPSTAPNQKTPRRKPSLAHFEPSKRPPKAVSEIDDLLELTEDVLKIEDFLHRYSFDRILDDNTVLTTDDVSQFEQSNSDVIERLDGISMVKSGEVRGIPVGGFRIHPEVQAILDKTCTSKIIPYAPGAAPNVPDIGTSPQDVKSRQNLAATIIREISAVNTMYEGNDRPPTVLPSARMSQSDLTGEVLKCRETLLSLRTKTTSQNQGFGVNYEPPALKPKTSCQSINSSRSYASVKLPILTARKMVAGSSSNATIPEKTIKNGLKAEPRPKKLPPIETRSREYLEKISEIGDSYADNFFKQVEQDILKEHVVEKAKKVERKVTRSSKGAMGDCASSIGGDTSESNETLRKNQTRKSIMADGEGGSGSTRARSRATGAGGDAPGPAKEKRRIRPSTNASGTGSKPVKKPSFK